jgi:hypothetical protein
MSVLTQLSVMINNLAPVMTMTEVIHVIVSLDTLRTLMESVKILTNALMAQNALTDHVITTLDLLHALAIPDFSTKTERVNLALMSMSVFSKIPPPTLARSKERTLVSTKRADIRAPVTRVG